MFTLCTCATVGRKESLWAAGDWDECPCEFLSLSEEVSGPRYEEKRKRLWSEALDCERALKWKGKGDDCIRSEGAILLNEWLSPNQKWEVRCLPWESMWPLSTAQTTHHRFVGVKKCGARTHDLPQREAIVWQQAPLFSNYHQDQLMSITRGILSHHKMPVNHAGPRPRKFDYNKGLGSWISQ